MKQLQSAYLGHLDKEAQIHELAELVESAKTSDGSATSYLKNRIRQFELRYELSSRIFFNACQQEIRRKQPKLPSGYSC